MTDAEFWESQREALRLLGDAVRRSRLKPLKTIHEKTADGHRLALVLFEEDGGQHVYGVEVDGLLTCTGTKAEAKAYYGRSW